MSKKEVILPLDVLKKAAHHASIELKRRLYQFKLRPLTSEAIISAKDIIITDNPKARELFVKIVEQHALDFYEHGLGQITKKSNPGSSPRVSKKSYALIPEIYGDNAPLLSTLSGDEKTRGIRRVIAPIISLSQVYMEYAYKLPLKTAFNFKEHMSDEEKKKVRFNQLRRFFITKIIAHQVSEAFKVSPEKIDATLKEMGISLDSDYATLSTSATRKKIVDHLK